MQKSASWCAKLLLSAPKFVSKALFTLKEFEKEISLLAYLRIEQSRSHAAVNLRQKLAIEQIALDVLRAVAGGMRVKPDRPREAKVFNLNALRRGADNCEEKKQKNFHFSRNLKSK